jgi:hypothetical protein
VPSVIAVNGSKMLTRQLTRRGCAHGGYADPGTEALRIGGDGERR